ncbi:hypothetical protein MRS44_011995 [Fusarium solani]|uniref:uncharacterized protein n=1 Tax=Fusarium solani TaxID=169388 RepID=UPI0032C43DC2|nr:hypothetical protein MRS44_011995 [Fusarium solani]
MDRRLVPDTKGLLDTALNVNQAQILFASFDEWFSETNLETIALTTCSVCRKVKFEQRVSDRSTTLVNEFTRDLPRPNCTNPVCSDCCLKSLSFSPEALRENWWSFSGSMISIPYPCGCSAEIVIRNRGSLQRMLRLAGDRSPALKLRTYDTAQHLMAVLDDIDLQPTLEARKVAEGLHQHLILNNQCSIYTELIHNFCCGSFNEWNSICTGYRGDWLWKILLFPRKLEANCNYTTDFCIACLRRHIETQLDQHGRSGYYLLTCPSLGCRRRLEYEEVRLYAGDEAFFK